MDINGLKNALMSVDIEVLKLMTAAKIQPSVVEGAFRQKSGTDGTTVARQFFENSSKSPEAIRWFESVLTNGLESELHRT